MEKERIVYIVHCVDTEGPLSESLAGTFERLRQIFGVDIEATRENLLKLQKGGFDLGNKTEEVMNLVGQKRVSFNETWEDIDKMLNRITSLSFRNMLPDSFGGGWVYNWFCVDHVGYDANPRKRDMGDHRIFDYFSGLLERDINKKDRVYFHYHPLPYNKMAHSCATFYFNQNHLFEILAKKIIDRKWFPSVFRPGFHTIRPDSNWFLEQWMPFDYSNQATAQDVLQPDAADGRFGDWRRSPEIWGAYHPSHDDYQVEGRCRRWIFRCLNMEARLRELTQQDVDEAFRQADKNMSSVLAFTDHDFRDMTLDINKVRGMIEKAGKKWKKVEFRYSNAVEAAVRHLKLERQANIGLKVDFFKHAISHDTIDMIVKTQSDIFGPQPFLAIKDKNGRYYYDNLDFALEKNCWKYTFDWQTFPFEKIEKIGVACADKYGVCEVVVHDCDTDRAVKNIINQD
ncbi:MAG: hypothetical protein Q7O04_07035 [Candidatus Omnitrophota bacterium]|nr:hypothetical protein [Candidatus Omnitrophota bacterium]